VGSGKLLVPLSQWKGTGTRVGSADGLWCGARLCRPCPAVPLPSRNDCTRTNENVSNLESFGEKTMAIRSLPNFVS
jgi:hypothetical protein